MVSAWMGKGSSDALGREGLDERGRDAEGGERGCHGTSACAFRRESATVRPAPAGVRHRPGPIRRFRTPLSPGAARPAHRGSIVGCGCWWSRTKRASPTRSRSACAAEGFDVDIADNGTDGLWRARETAYAAIILDILLPGMNGFKVCRTLRDEGVWTPILMLTAKDGELDEAEALDTGADDFLCKPFSFVVLVARLRALLRRGSTPRPTVLTVGSLTLDPASRQCRRGDTTRRPHRA